MVCKEMYLIYRFIQIVLSLTNADVDNASLKENWVTRSVPMVTKKLAALIQVFTKDISLMRTLHTFPAT